MPGHCKRPNNSVYMKCYTRDSKWFIEVTGPLSYKVGTGVNQLLDSVARSVSPSRLEQDGYTVHVKEPAEAEMQPFKYKGPKGESALLLGSILLMTGKWEMGADHSDSQRVMVALSRCCPKTLSSEINIFLAEHMYESAKFSDDQFLMKLHISSLRGLFQKYSPYNVQYDWDMDPFNAAAPADFSTAEENQLEMT
ncbi:zinc finger BED domain-containing protein 5-like [Tachysurus ichikawai]